eukprot:9498730-Pyramimonas_sp.AAC.1
MSAVYVRAVRCTCAVLIASSTCAGIFIRRTNQMQEPRVYSHDGPIRRMKRGSILATDQSDA